MAKKLVIVESPTKAKTISRFLGRDFVIKSSNGHIRDLPKSKMGVDIEHDFEPHYVIPTKSRKLVNQLKKEAENASAIFFATDEDREGEAISWHLTQIFGTPEDKIHRITFDEITETAIKKAITQPRQVDKNMVNAQQARRVLDRLVGYELSPFLWKKIFKGLSAGRVQSAALRVIVEREREIEAFKPKEYWLIEADFEKTDHSKPQLTARLHKINGQKVDKFEIKNQPEANKITEALSNAGYKIDNVELKQLKRLPYAPFTTSTLQQEANIKYGFSSRQTMYLAQQLYEGVALGKDGSVGLITYMRTDSVNLSSKFLNEAKDFITQTFGKEYALSSPRYFKKKQRLAQEAHEAIRPTDVRRTPESIKDCLDARMFKIYSIIWRRAVASQMPDAQIDQTAIDVVSTNNYTFRTTGSTIRFDGFYKVYPNNQKDVILPSVKKGELINLLELKIQQKFTEPPARYSEAGLVKILEEYGIGRPSTYAPTISTLLSRKYIEKEQRRLKPTEMGFLVNDVLVEHFPQIVDYKFTAQMEENLDEIAAGKKDWVPVIKDFYTPFKDNLRKKESEVSKKALTEKSTDEVCEKCGQPMVIKMGRFGKFLACSGFPECKNTKKINGNGEKEEPELVDEKCPECGRQLLKKVGRYGPFLGCSGYPDCKYLKKIENSTGIKCPECNLGEIVERRSRRGKPFYSCNQYPKCKFALWSKPTGEKCPECGSLLVFGKKTHNCSNKECKYSRPSDLIK